MAPRSIGIIGAGPAGLAAAKLAIERGFDITVFERHAHLGGIWNPHANGAYASVRMQTSQRAFHYSDFAPIDTACDFLTRQGLYDYLSAYSSRFGVQPHVRFQSEVVSVQRAASGWSVTARTSSGYEAHAFDFVIVANGELWRSRLINHTGPAPMTAKDYSHPDGFAGRKVLVVGGGVSGADIAAELSRTAEVHWSIRRPVLLLPRMWDDTPNDGCFSYVARREVQGWKRERYLGFLSGCMPGYMERYAATGMLPDTFENNAIHVNDSAVPAVAEGRLQLRPGVACLREAVSAQFLDGTTETYDTVLLCAGYQPPDYSFIQDFSPGDLYEHFFFAHDPTLAILNTPPMADGYGTACPYFEAIAFWMLQVFDGARSLPSSGERRQWCEEQAARPFRKTFYDCWLETIRIGLLSGQLPDPRQDFRAYWHIVSNGVTPLNLCADPKETWVPAYDDLVDLADIRVRTLASLPSSALRDLALGAQITATEAVKAEQARARAVAPALC